MTLRSRFGLVAFLIELVFGLAVAVGIVIVLLNLNPSRTTSHLAGWFGIIVCAVTVLVVFRSLASRPFIRFTIDRDRVFVRNSALIGRFSEQFLLSQLVLLPIDVYEDSDTSPFYKCIVATPKGRKVVVSEGYDEVKVQADWNKIAQHTGDHPV